MARDRRAMIRQVVLAVDEAKEQFEFWQKELHKLENLRFALEGDSRDECWATREYDRLFGSAES